LAAGAVAASDSPERCDGSEKGAGKQCMLCKLLSKRPSMRQHARQHFQSTASLLLTVFLPALAHEKADRLNASDIFNLQFASDPQISPDGKRVVYVRAFADIMSDKRLSNL